jgi:hypothetical protein
MQQKIKKTNSPLFNFVMTNKFMKKIVFPFISSQVVCLLKGKMVSLLGESTINYKCVHSN